MNTKSNGFKAQKLARWRLAMDRIDTARAATQAVVTSGKCPTCGSAIRHNNSLTGWVQCAQFGAAGFRADASKPSCDWQGFTE
jgi:hypothetical protein